MHLALEDDIHTLTRGENRVKRKIGRNHTLYEITLITMQGLKNIYIKQGALLSLDAR